MNPLYVRLGLQSREFTRGILKAQNDLTNMRKSTEKLSASFKSMKRIAVVSFAGWRVKELAMAIANVGIEMDRLKRGMNAAAGSVYEGGKSIQFLKDESMRLGLVFRTQVKGFQQLAAAAKGTKITLTDVKEMYLGIAEASTVMQLSQDQNKFALYALQQMISKGVVTMEELRRQLGDQIPGAFQIAARAMNMTTQELIKTVSTGNLLAEDFLPRFAKQLRKEMAGSVEDAAKSIYSNINRIKNMFYELASEIFKNSGAVEMLNDNVVTLIKIFEDKGKVEAIKNFTKIIIDMTSAVIALGKGFIDAGILVDKGLSKIGASFSGFAEDWAKYKDVMNEIGRVMSGEVNWNTGKLNAYDFPMQEGGGGFSPWDWDRPDNTENLEKASKEYFEWVRSMNASLRDIDHLMTEYYEALKWIDDQIDEALESEFRWLDEQEKKLKKIEEAAARVRDEMHNWDRKDFWQVQAEDRWEVNSRALEAMEQQEYDYSARMEKIYEDYMKNIRSIFTETFEDLYSGNIDSWEDMLKSMKDLYVKYTSEMSSKALSIWIESGGKEKYQGIFKGSNAKYRYLAAGAAGLASSYGQSKPNPWVSTASGAMQGYMMTGTWQGAAVGGAAGFLGSLMSGGGKEEDQITLGGYGPYAVRPGQFSSTYPTYTAGPDYSNWWGHHREQGMAIQEAMVAEKNKVTKIFYKDILTSVSDASKKMIMSKMEDFSFQTGKWDIKRQDWAAAPEIYAKRLNREITSRISKIVYSEITGTPLIDVYGYGPNGRPLMPRESGMLGYSMGEASKAYQMLDAYTQQELVKPYYDNGQLQYFGSLEDISNALDYLEEINSIWSDISFTVDESVGKHIAYQEGIYNLNSAFDEMVKKLNDLGFAEEYIIQIESQRIDALEQYAKEMQIQRTDILNQWKIISGVAGEQEAQLINLAIQYREAKDALEDFGATGEELLQLESYYQTSIQNIMNGVVDAIDDTFSKLHDAWSSFFNTMMTDLAPVQSAEYYGATLSTMFTGATTEEGIKNLLDFVTSEYLPFMKSYGAMDYASLWQSIMDLTGDIEYNGQAISGMNMSDKKVIIQIGDKTVGQLMLSELTQERPELVRIIRRIVNG